MGVGIINNIDTRQLENNSTLIANMENKEEISLALFRLRKSLDESRQSFADKIDSHRNSVENAEKGRPTLDYIIKVCDFFEVSLSDFFDKESLFWIKIPEIQ